MDRLAGDLAVDVPKADVNGANGVDRDLPVLLPHVMPNGADVLGVAAQQLGFEELNQALGEVVAADVQAPQERVTGDAGVGLHADQAELAIAKAGADTGVPRLRMPIEQVDPNVGDFHAAAPAS